MNNGKKKESIVGLEIPELPNERRFRTKDNTLVATGYTKIKRDEDGVVRIHFTNAQVYVRNLEMLEEGHSARGVSKDAARVEFLQLQKPYMAGFPGEWVAAASDLYVDGRVVYAQGPEPQLKPKPTAQIVHVYRGGVKPPKVPSRTSTLK